MAAVRSSCPTAPQRVGSASTKYFEGSAWINTGKGDVAEASTLPIAETSARQRRRARSVLPTR
jgi:hypothetical protein